MPYEQQTERMAALARVVKRTSEEVGTFVDTLKHQSAKDFVQPWRYQLDDVVNTLLKYASQADTARSHEMFLAMADRQFQIVSSQIERNRQAIEEHGGPDAVVLG